MKMKQAVGQLLLWGASPWQQIRSSSHGNSRTGWKKRTAHHCHSCLSTHSHTDTACALFHTYISPIPPWLQQNKGVPMGSTRSALIISNWTLGNQRSPLFNKQQRLKLVTLCFGANDASINRRDATWRMVPEVEYRSVK